MNARGARTTCLALHTVLVLGHIAVVCIWANEAENALVVSRSRADNINQYISLISQGFIVPYGALLLFLTHSLAVQKIVEKDCTLTAMHDVASAWNGIVSSLTSLRRQVSLPSYVWGITHVTVYLGSMVVLPITTPGLFTIQNFNQSSMLIPTTLGMPVVVNASTFAWDNFGNPWDIAAQLIPYLVGGNGISTTGLFRGTIYDIIGSNGSIGEVTVNATTANVTCGTVANKGSSGSEACSPLSLINATYEDYNLTMCYEPLGLGNEKIGDEYKEVIHAFTMYDYLPNSTHIPFGRHAIFFVATTVIDRLGAQGTVVQDATLQGVTIVGCTLSWVQSTANVSATTRNITSPGVFSMWQPAQWTEWQPTISSGAVYGVGYPSEDNQVDSWSDMLEAVGTQASLPDGNVTWTVMEQYLMTKLGNGTNFHDTITLADLEMALSEMTAAVYWAVAHALTYSLQCGFIIVNECQAQSTRPMSRLSISITAAVIGLIASLALSLSAVLLTNGGSGNRKGASAMDSLDVLQATWLVGQNPAVLHRMLEIREPSLRHLREEWPQ